MHFRKIYTHVGSSCTSIIVLLPIVTTELKLNFFLENPFAKGQLKSWYDFFLKIRKLYAYASLLITSYYDQVLMKSTGVNISPVQRGNKGLWSFFCSGNLSKSGSITIHKRIVKHDWELTKQC